MVSAIRNLCGSLCKSFVCCINTFYLADGNVGARLQSFGEDLSRMVEDPSTIKKLKKVSHIVEDVTDGEGFESKVCHGILRFVGKQFLKLDGKQVDDALERVNAAAEFVDVNLERRYREKQPLTKKESKKVKKQVKVVKQYGSRAAKLFQTFRDCLLNKANINLSIPYKSRRVLYGEIPVEGYSAYLADRVLEAVTFQTLSVNDKKVFLAAAKYMPKKMAKQPISWRQDVRHVEELTLQEPISA